MGHLEEPHVFLAPEPSLQPQINLFTISAERVPEPRSTLGKCFITQPSSEPCTVFNTPVTCNDTIDKEISRIVIFTSRFIQETSTMHHNTDLFYLPQKYYYAQMGSRLSKAVEELVKKKKTKYKRGEVIHTLGGFSASHQASRLLKIFFTS